MAKFREFNRIPQNSIEQFIPVHLLDKEYFKNMGILRGGISILRKGCVISRPKGREYHIVIVTLKGTGKFIMENGVELVAEQGQYFFSAADGQGHKHLPISDEWRICWIQIEKSGNWFVAPPSDYMLSKCSSFREIGNCFESIISEYSEQYRDHTTIEELQCQLLMYYVKREIDLNNYSGKNMMYLKKFNQLWHDVSINIGRPWDIETLCDYMGLSKAHLVRLCNEFYQTSPANKIKQIKMDHAYALLANLDYRVSDIAEVVGYNSVSSFSVAFKKYFHILPKDVQMK